MRKFFLSLIFIFITTSAWAQNAQCPDRPIGDSSNACANTRFVQGKGSTGNTINAASFGIFPSNTAAVNNTQFVAAINYLHSLGGGDLILPCGVFNVTLPIELMYPYITISGSSAAPTAIILGQTPYCSVISAGPSFSGLAVLYQHSPFTGPTAPINNGGGFVGLSVRGNNNADRLLLVDTIWSGKYDLYLDGQVTTEVARFTSTGDVGTNIAGGSDQHNDINLRVIAYGSANGVVFSGNATGNFSINPNVTLDITSADGDGLILENADNNIFWARVQSTGTGRACLSKANAVEVQSARDNQFSFYSANKGCVVQGTDTATVASNINSMWLDGGNATPFPILGTGASSPVINLESQQSVTLSTLGGGSIAGIGTVRWSQTASKIVTGTYTLTLSSAVAGVLIGVTLPISENLSVNPGTLSGYDSTNRKGLNGFVIAGPPDHAYYTYSDGTFPAASGPTTHNFTIIYEGY